MVRAPDSGPEGLGLMPVPQNTFRVHTEFVLVKPEGPKVLWAESRVQGTGDNFPPQVRDWSKPSSWKDRRQQQQTDKSPNLFQKF
ncbi:hypothetical protein TNCV_2244721 [Trichonephila clavipes]|nr:hypothetical protein TNCV_2244721 [Trichonephila clavipes]